LQNTVSFFRALLQKRPIILRSLQIVATPCASIPCASPLFIIPSAHQYIDTATDLSHSHPILYIQTPLFNISHVHHSPYRQHNSAIPYSSYALVHINSLIFWPLKRSVFLVDAVAKLENKWASKRGDSESRNFSSHEPSKESISVAR